MKKSRILAHLLILSLLLPLISGCGTLGEISATKGPEETTRPENEFWIVAEYGHTDLYDTPIQEFREAHPELTVTLEIFPTDLEEREVYLQQLRVQIMAGKGPDVYLMGNSGGLFADVTQSMSNGVFTDIGEYYDADTELDKENFVPAVMEAGVLDGARYVLPLRYDIPLLYVYVDQLEAAGLRLDSLGNGFSGLTEVIRAMGNESVAIGNNLGNYLLHLYPEALDYEKENVVLTEEDMAAFLQSCKDLLISLTAPYGLINNSYYIQSNDYWGLPRNAFIGDGKGGYQSLWVENGASVFLDSMFSLGDNLRVAEATNNELAVLPFRTADGSLVANVTAYGAVGAGCNDPALAYEFLRKLLLEDSQWKNQEGKSSSLYLGGWPVLAEDCGVVIEQGLWSAVSQLEFNKEYCAAGFENRKEVMASIVLMEEDFSILDAEISKAVFYPAVITDIATKIANRLDPSMNSDAANVDLHEFAQELLQDLHWRLAEG